MTMDNYNTLFDSDLAEHEYMMSQSVRSLEVFSECEDCGKNPDRCREIKDGYPSEWVDSLEQEGRQ